MAEGPGLASNQAHKPWVRLGPEEPDEGILDLAIHEVRLPEDVDQVVRHLGLGQQPQGLVRVCVRIGDPDDSEELLFDRNGGMAVVDAPFVAIGQGHPLDAGDSGLGEHLAGPLVIVEVYAESLGFDEEARLPQQEQGVVDRVVAREALVLELDVF